MTTKHDVITTHQIYPWLTATDIANRLDCHPAYVRATATRNGLNLPGAYGPRVAREPRQPPRKKAKMKAATMAKLIEAARRVWAEPGSYDTQGIRDVASAAGLSTGAVFANWSGKAALWRDAMGYEPPVDGPEVRALLQRMAQLRAAA